MTGHQPEEILVDAGAVRLGALVYGDPEAPPVVTTHGVGDLAWSMDSLARALAAHHRVISLDLRGHGRSETGAYGMLHLIGDLRGAIESLELVDPILVGHSLGGQVTAQFAGLFPDVPRLAVLIESIGPPSRADVDDHRSEGRRQIAHERIELIRHPAGRRSMPDLAAAVHRLRATHPLLDPERARFLADKGTRPAPGGGIEWVFDPWARDWIAGHDHATAEERWQGVTCPVLAILGRDSYTTYWSKRMPPSWRAGMDGALTDAERDRRLANFADHALVEIEGAGHMVQYDKPDELNQAVLDFLSTMGSDP
ncbi:MAG: alpha/beta hydrolase [Actinomycetia bacterium]|nr:alpha/beta hydrolase [Actinomycetes bacterium]